MSIQMSIARGTGGTGIMLGHHERIFDFPIPNPQRHHNHLSRPVPHCAGIIQLIQVASQTLSEDYR